MEPPQHRLPRGVFDPDLLQKAPDDTLALLRFSLTEHLSDLGELVHQRLDDRVDASR